MRKEENRATGRLEIVWVDLSGPHAVKSRTGNNYITNLVDDQTGMPWLIPLKTKDEAFSELVAWEHARETETGLQVGTYRTDSVKLKSHQMREWLRARGTDHQFTAPTPPLT